MIVQNKATDRQWLSFLSILETTLPLSFLTDVTSIIHDYCHLATGGTHCLLLRQEFSNGNTRKISSDHQHHIDSPIMNVGMERKCVKVVQQGSCELLF